MSERSRLPWYLRVRNHFWVGAPPDYPDEPFEAELDALEREFASHEQDEATVIPGQPTTYAEALTGIAERCDEAAAHRMQGMESAVPRLLGLITVAGILLTAFIVTYKHDAWRTAAIGLLCTAIGMLALCLASPFRTSGKRTDVGLEAARLTLRSRVMNKRRGANHVRAVSDRIGRLSNEALCVMMLGLVCGVIGTLAGV